MVARAATRRRSHRRTTRSPESKLPSRAATSATATDAGPAFHFVGGKGGVGKTTCAAAFALTAAARGRRVLVASTDPAPSLGDALGVCLGYTPRRVGPLSAVEVHAASALRRWIDERRSVLERIAVQGTWLDGDDVTRLLQLSLPGIDELAALLEIARLAGSRKYDLVVVDTAPTGHTLRMLAMPATLRGIAVVFDGMRQKQRVVEEALRGAWQPAEEDALIDALAESATQLAGLLRDPARTRMSWVTLAEPLAVSETTEAVAALREAGISVDSIVVNRLTPQPSSPCGHCDARRASERRALKGLPSAAPVTAVTARDLEPRGVRALAAIGKELNGSLPSSAAAPRAGRWSAELAGPRQAPADLLPAGARLVLFGGKGGVGKTTCAAAVAVLAAQREPDRKVLLISTDPAHSLGHVLGARLSDAPRPVEGGPPNLDVREIDPAQILARIRIRYVQAIDRVFDRMAGGGSFDAVHDRAVMTSLIDLAPPGLDELTAVLEITDAISADPPKWGLVVMDTAPTGHALRLLEMPTLIQEWSRALMSILLKYQGVARVGEFGEILLNLSRGVGRLRDLLASPDRAVFVAVTRAAALPRLETARLVRRLGKLKIHVPAVVINAVGRGGCRRCRRIAAVERREVVAAREAVGRSGRLVILAGAAVPPPSGAAGLARWGRTAWRGMAGYHQGR